MTNGDLLISVRNLLLPGLYGLAERYDIPALMSDIRLNFDDKKLTVIVFNPDTKLHRQQDITLDDIKNDKHIEIFKSALERMLKEIK